MIVVLDRQHVGKPGRDDKGARAELDGEVVHEVDLTLGYIEHAAALLTAEGHDVVILDEGWYQERHRKAADIARANPDEAVAYVAAHCNAGGGSYGLAIHDQRSRGGRALAEAVADVLGANAAPYLDRAIVRAAERGGTWGRAMTTIAGIYDGPANIVGICYEPLFMDQERHADLMRPGGLRVVGQALALGCMTWAGE